MLWLDGRKLGKDIEDMAMMVASAGRDGVIENETELDGRVCDCCQTSVAEVPEGLIAVYRDRSSDEVRDISVIRYEGRRWSQPRTLAKDNCIIDACPVNGPSVSANGRNAVVAWFTEANGMPKVQAAFSKDSGKTFGAPVRLDEAMALGRVDAAMMPSGDALVSWVDGDQGAHIRIRRIGAKGIKGPVLTVAATTTGL